MRGFRNYVLGLFFGGSMLVFLGVVNVSCGLEYFPPLGLSTTFPDDFEVSEICLELLRSFNQRYEALTSCMISFARPVRVCQRCYVDYNNFVEISANISTSTQIGPGNITCGDSLVRSDRLMLLYNLNSTVFDLWDSARCFYCLTEDQKNLSESTLNFTSTVNQTLSCFEKYQGNHTELCTQCKATYRRLNEMYSYMDSNHSLCIDVEDAMNSTRRLWSKNFGCSFSREENVAVVAVSSFMLFLPVIFYLSNFLHSEQKKRKLIHPRRAKSNHSLMNIQDKFS